MRSIADVSSVGRGSFEEEPKAKRAKISKASKLFEGEITENDIKMIVFGMVARVDSKWHNNSIAVLNTHTLHQFAGIICEECLPLVRSEDCGGNGVGEHLWTFRKASASSKSSVCWQTVSKSDSFSSEYKNTVIRTMDLQEGDLVKFIYDYGNTTCVDFKVLAIGDVEGLIDDYPKTYSFDISNPASLTCVQYKLLHGPLTAESLRLSAKGFNFGARFVSLLERQAILESVPAYGVIKKHRLDNRFPHFSNAVLRGGAHHIFSMGLSSILTREDDSTFAKIANNQFFAQIPFQSLNEFLSISETAYSPKANSPAWCFRRVYPADLTADEEEDFTKNAIKSYSSLRGLRAVYRYTEREKRMAIATLKRLQFDFAKLFPKTTSQLTNGRFRWFSYKGGTLRVCIGRADASGDCPVEHILREWQGGPFESFHDLMCAVESSWSERLPTGEVDIDDRVLPCDADRGPLFPFHPEPARIFTAAEDCKVLCKRSRKTQRISHLILDGQYLYSSHDNEGIVRKWDLAANVQLAKATAVYIPADLDRKTLEKFSWRVYDKRILGMLLTPERSQLYVWASYANICVLNCQGAGLALQKIIDLDVGYGYYPRSGGGDDDDSSDDSSTYEFRPYANVAVMGSISSGFFAAEKVLFVGINAMAATPPSLRDDCDREDLCEGNILVIDVSDVHSTYRRLGTWNGHKFPILALAVNESHLFSIDGLSSHGAQYLIMWSLSTNYEIGHALRRLRFNDVWKPSFGFLNLQSRRLHRVRSVQGIHLLGNKLYLTTEYGMDMCVINIANLSIEGYVPIGLPVGYGADELACGLASYGSTLVPWNQTIEETYFFSAQKMRDLALKDANHRARNVEDGSFITESIKITYDPGNDYLDMDKEDVEEEDDGDEEDEEDEVDDEEGDEEDEDEKDDDDDEEEEKDAKDEDRVEGGDDDGNDNDDNKGDSLSEASKGRVVECKLYTELKAGMKRSQILGVADCQVKFPREHRKAKDSTQDSSAGETIEFCALDVNDKYMVAGYSNGAIRYFSIPVEGLLGVKGWKPNFGHGTPYLHSSCSAGALRGETDQHVMVLSDEDIDEERNDCTIS